MILLTFAPFLFLAWMTADKQKIREARQRANKELRWLYIPSLLFWAALFWPW